MFTTYRAREIRTKYINRGKCTTYSLKVSTIYKFYF